MITSTGILHQLKCCAIIALLALTTSASAQQLYSDSAVAARTEQSLCMILPDSTQVIAEANSLVLTPEIYMATIDVSGIWVTQCGECFTYNFSQLNFSSLLVAPVWSSIPCTVGPICVYAPSIPPVTKSHAGISATSPVRADLSRIPVIAHAAKRLSDLVHPQESLSCF